MVLGPRGAALLALVVCSPASAGPVLQVLSTSLDRPTLHALGVQVLITGDDDHDASIAVRWRPACTTAWRDAPPLFRVRPETVVARTVPEQFAGSVFDLAPGTSYEIELHAVDGDGPVDQTWTQSGVTRPLPIDDPAVPRLRNVSDATGLRSALSSARAGDVILLADGSYPGSFFSLSASGTAADPIVIRGQSRDGVVLDGQGCAGCNVLEVYGSFIHVEDLTIRAAERALRFQGAGTTGNVVRRVRIEDVVHGIGSAPGQTDFYLCDNLVAGRLAWPLVYSDDGGLHADDQGIRVDGDGHVVCHNRITGFGDPMINFAVGGRSYDFYGNEISEIYGDGTELDRAEGNGRCFHNRWTNVYTAISLQPIYGGPAYVLRNVVVNVADEPIKLKSLGGVEEPSGAVIAHNTFVSPGLALNLQTPITQHNFALLDNLFVGPAVTTRGYTVDWTAKVNLDRFDSNGYWPDGNFWFGTVGAARRTYASFAAVQAAGQVEGLGRLLAPPIFATGLASPTTFRTLVPLADVTLDAGSNALDAGLRLPGIDDGYVGGAPDLGAWEVGCPQPVYGPRARGAEGVTNRINCLPEAPCAPAGDLLRDWLTVLQPATPTRATLFARLRSSPPYVAGLASGAVDPDPTVLADGLRPLVVYELVSPAPTLLLTKAGGRVRLEWR